MLELSFISKLVLSIFVFAPGLIIVAGLLFIGLCMCIEKLYKKLGE